ncbi:MAG: hypothetical protein AAGM36_10335 [Cyanobacteria bacterium J06597_1]
MGHALQKERKLVPLAQDLKTLLQWLCHDVFELAGPSLDVRQELFDFIVVELQKLECKQYPAIRILRQVLKKQRDDLLAFAGVLDRKLAAIARSVNLPARCLFAVPKETDFQSLLGALDSIAFPALQSVSPADGERS